MTGASAGRASGEMASGPVISRSRSTVLSTAVSSTGESEKSGFLYTRGFGRPRFQKSSSLSLAAGGVYVTFSKYTQNLINSHHYDHQSSKFQCYHYFSGKSCFLKGLSTSAHHLISFVKMQSQLLTVTFLKAQQYFPLISHYE